MQLSRLTTIPAVTTVLLATAALGAPPAVAVGAQVRPAIAAERSAPPTESSLAALASKVGLRIGTAVDTDALAADATYRHIAATQFSSVTPENVMKWQLVEPQRGHYVWGPADRLVAFAESHGQLVRGHTLVWHNQLPDWLTSGTFTKAQLRQILHKHIRDEVTHFRGKIWQWDVVNEAFNDDGTLRETIWLDALGPGYIADAFRWAHEADPGALLMYNDYNIEGLGPKSDAVYAMVKRLQTQGVPIDGVGMQGHLDTQYPLPVNMRGNMARFAKLGLDTAVTEADVRVTLPMTNQESLAQATGYTAMLQACLAVRRCLSFTVWGFTDRYSWVPGVFPGEGAATLYNANYRPKPAYFAVHRALALATGAPHRP